MCFIDEHNILSQSQIGFPPKYSTSGHIFAIHTLTDKQINQNKGKIFPCVVDFKRAFDSIWHDSLLYKLSEMGVGGKTYDVIKSMYSNNKCAFKIGKKQTDLFS